MPGTTRLYLIDDHCVEAEATVVAVAAGALACDRTCFYRGGGGQPPDQGSMVLAGGTIVEIVSAHADPDGVVWHVGAVGLSPDLRGHTVRLRVDAARRQALTRHHTVLHVLNTVALREHGGWITGVQIGVAYSRIDLTLARLTPAICAALEARVNEVLAADRALRAYTITEAEFRARGDLRRTREAEPPVVDGRVRVVEIEGFDAQACGGTHVRATGEVGRLSIFRTENKGRLNKRLYVRLSPP
jgi:misacylated tRNA(Ala) deacylase